MRKHCSKQNLLVHGWPAKQRTDTTCCVYAKRPLLGSFITKIREFYFIRNCLSAFLILHLLSVISNDCQSLNCKLLISGKQISRTPVWIYAPVKWRALERSVNVYSLCIWYIWAEHENRHSNDWYLIFYPTEFHPLCKWTRKVSCCAKHWNTDVCEWMDFRRGSRAK